MVVQDSSSSPSRTASCGAASPPSTAAAARARAILHPIWERAADGVRGWVVTRKSPLKTAHLARTPYVSCTYWDATHDVAIADCHAAWEEDRDEHARVWELYAAAPAPLGYDFHAIWPDGPSADGRRAAARSSPWRLHVADAMTVMTPRVWKPDTAYR